MYRRRGIQRQRFPEGIGRRAYIRLPTSSAGIGGGGGECAYGRACVRVRVVRVVRAVCVVCCVLCVVCCVNVCVYVCVGVWVCE
ncbi:hypothetical protein K431DRAFT_85997 [Polychaeton citri CBS 116435]|uniref:Uncharacterized protein n=1 Tax=Polychaeton citri CBS 116435 TaxID=1314669 RepID=A0A9P4Q980_9PEZI|nr:hypothetical protein K431DRAFT_85997 [Polychaeton citri CBS 116435]